MGKIWVIPREEDSIKIFPILKEFSDGLIESSKGQLDSKVEIRMIDDTCIDYVLCAILPNSKRRIDLFKVVLDIRTEKSLNLFLLYNQYNTLIITDIDNLVSELEKIIVSDEIGKYLSFLIRVDKIEKKL